VSFLVTFHIFRHQLALTGVNAFTEDPGQRGWSIWRAGVRQALYGEFFVVGIPPPVPSNPHHSRHLSRL